jgi:hypothetical protein
MVDEAPDVPQIETDTLSITRKVLERASTPLTAKQIYKLLPPPYRMRAPALARGLMHKGPSAGVFPWPAFRGQRRFWTKDPEVVAEAEAAAALSKSAMTAVELEKALKKPMFGCSKSAAHELRKKVLPRLVSQNRVFQHPPISKQRSFRYSAFPPDPATYLGKVRQEYNIVQKKLAKVGVSNQAILQALLRMLPGSGTAGVSGPGEAPEEDLGGIVIQRALETEPAAGQQAMVSLRKLRKAVGAPKESFDRAVLRLARDGFVWLHRHVDPAQMDDSERAAAVPDGSGGFYIGMVLREGKWKTRFGMP